MWEPEGARNPGVFNAAVCQDGQKRARPPTSRMAPTVYKVTESATKKTNVSIYFHKTTFTAFARECLTEPKSKQNLHFFQMRKPAVEKMRRDRINRCIEQLKVLLKTEMQASQPCSKLEKADILEMAVIHMKKSMRNSADAQCYADGFSRCIQETARFLSVHNQLQTSKFVLMGHFDSTVQPKTSSKVMEDSCQDVSKRTGAHALWRPW